MQIVTISYTIIFVLTSALYILLESFRTEEIRLKKEITLPIVPLTILKMMPAILAIIFTIITMPKTSVLYIILPITFFLFAIGDFFMEIQKPIGILSFGLGHITISTGYVFALIEVKEEIIANKIGFIIFGVIIVLILTIDAFFFTRYLSRSSYPEKYQRYKYVALFYESLLSLHLVVASLLTFAVFKINPGIIVIALGILLFTISDKIIMIREFHFKPRKSVLLIMAAYYLALFSISLQTIFQY
ncbi:MAG: hypothetical protein GF308_08460 [Candidatus Heimdallarchaeota archaeon]|nr:hypothetical protein [Candidatus Heimdallarchaeota archaeon]